VFDEKFLQNVRKREFHSFDDVSVVPSWTPEMQQSFKETDWQRVITLLDGHPSEKNELRWDKLGYVLTSMENRAGLPYFAKQIIEQMASIFSKNNISCHMFGGFTDKSESFKIHRDAMDVLYLQLVGEVYWSTYDAHNKSVAEPNIERKNTRLIYKQHFKPGRMYWVPRQRYHLVEPITSRAGFSFGVEGEPDPSTYV